MAWYDAGTVNVTLNSATVTGVGTQWVAGARQGEAFVGPDGRLYEVLNIASNTSLTLTRPYRGATQAAQPYALAPFQGYVKELADRAAELLRRYSDALVLAEGAVQRTSIGSKYAADTNQILPGFAYGLGGRPDAFPPVSADDITAPPGIYYVLDVRHTGFPRPYGILVRSGGRVEGDSWLFDRFYSADSDSYERKSINGGAWTPWDPMLHKANAAFHLGLKSAAFAELIGDVGAGAVMNSGSNAGGSWWRFQSGLQICATSDLAVPWLDLQYSPGIWTTPSIRWYFPLAFTGIPACSGHIVGGVGGGFVGLGGDATAPSYTSFSVKNSSSSASVNVMSAIAIGRWK